MKTWKKKITAALLAAVCLTGAAAPLTVEAATTTQKIIYGAAALLFISSYYTRMDDKAGLQLLDQCQQQTGVYESAEADNRVQSIYENIGTPAPWSGITMCTYPPARTLMPS